MPGIQCETGQHFSIDMAGNLFKLLRLADDSGNCATPGLESSGELGTRRGMRIGDFRTQRSQQTAGYEVSLVDALQR